MLDDPAGNSFIENPHAPHPDPGVTCQTYRRTPAQDAALGFHRERPPDPPSEATTPSNVNGPAPPRNRAPNPVAGPMAFPTPCPGCRAPAETRVCVVPVPRFREVVAMCLSCERCGCRSGEARGGGAVAPRGTRHAPRAAGPRDLAREVLRSDAAGAAVPELDLELE